MPSAGSAKPALQPERIRTVEAVYEHQIARRYRVSSVPKTVVGEVVEFVGAGPESMLLQHVQQAAAGGTPQP